MSVPASPPGLSARFVVVAVLFVTCLLASNVAAVKLIEVGGFVLHGAIVIFPISYIIGDVLTEVYGYPKTRLVIWLGFLATVFMVPTFPLVGLLPAPRFWARADA